MTSSSQLKIGDIDSESMNTTSTYFTIPVSSKSDLSTKSSSSQLNFAEAESDSMLTSTNLTLSGILKDNENENKKKKKSQKFDNKLIGPYDPPEFPSLPIFERIVAVEIPHLYDFTATEAQSITFNELNSFPPLFPLDYNLSQFEKFQALKAAVKYIRCEPFFSWTELLSKLHTSLIETDSSHTKSLLSITEDNNFGKIILDIVKSIKKDDDDDVLQPAEDNDEITFDQNQVILDLNEVDPASMVDQNQEEFDYDQLQDQNFGEDVLMPIFDKDPFTFVTLTPKMFVPTIEQANMIGSDVFEDNA